MSPHVGHVYFAHVNGRICRVVVLAIRLIAEHICGGRYRKWAEYRCETLDTRETIYRRPAELVTFKGR